MYSGHSMSLAVRRELYGGVFFWMANDSQQTNLLLSMAVATMKLNNYQLILTMDANTDEKANGETCA